MNSHNPLQNVQAAVVTRSQPLEQVSGLQRSWEQPEVAAEIKKKVDAPRRPEGTYRILKRRGAK